MLNQRISYIIALALIAGATSLPAQVATDGNIPGDMNAGGTSGSPAEYVIGQSSGYSWSFGDSDATNVIRVGYTTDYNQLTIQNSATADLESHNISLGYSSGSDHNSVIVDGASTSVTNVTNVVVGENGSHNSFTIQSGASVTGAGLYVGSALDESGNSITITGSGSNFTGTGALYLGSQSSATVNVANGGTLATSNRVEVSWESQVTVTGSDSSLTTGLYAIVQEDSSLSVLAGASMDIGTFLRVNSNAGNYSNLLVSGTDSIVTVDQAILGANGIITLSDGALLASASSFTADAAGALRLDEGVFAWFGDHEADLASFIVGGTIEISDGLGGWTTANGEDLNYQYFAGDHVAAETFSGYANLGGYTIIGTASAVPEPSSYVVIVGAFALMLSGGSRRRHLHQRAQIMNNSFSSVMRFLYLLGLSIASSLSAQIVVSNWNISGDTVTFDIAGQIQNSATLAANGSQVLYIGDPGNTSWISTGSTTGSVTNTGGGSINLSTSSFGYAASNGSPADGDHLYLIKDGFQSWSKLDSIAATVSLSGGTLVPAAISPENLIVSAGFYYPSGGSYNAFPNVESQVGYGVASAVPEPSTYAVFLGVSALAAAGFQRRRTRRTTA